jgi:hypothetical protein
VHYLRKTGNAYLNDEFSRDFVVRGNGKAEKKQAMLPTILRAY